MPVAPHLPHELDERPALALPTHPRALGLVEDPIAYEQVERTTPVFRLIVVVELRDRSDGRLDDRPVRRHGGLWRRFQVSKQRERDVRITIRQVCDLERGDHATRGRLRRQQRRDDDQGARVVRDRFAVVQLGQDARGEDQR